MEERQSFNEICESNGIKLFEGFIIDRCTSDITLLNPSDFVEYCRINNIKSVILTYTFDDVEELDVDQIKLKLRRFFDKKMQEYPYTDAFRPKYITQDYYLPAWTEVLEKIDQEDFKNDHTDEDDEPIMVEAWAVQSGCRISTVVYEKEEDSTDTSVTEKEVLNKYARLINEKLQFLRAEAEKESQRIIKEKELATIAEIETIIRNNNDLINYTTQKARYEYADRIQIVFQEEKGCDWLTKKQVRSLVDHRYFKLTE